MESEECKMILAFDEKIFKIFSDFMTRVTQFEELVAVGSRLLDGFCQGLEFLRRPPINNTSDLVNQIIAANKTKRVLKYFEAGCKNAYEGMQNINKLHTTKLGLLDHLSKAKSLVDELEGFVREVTGIIETANKSRLTFEDEAIGEEPCPGPTAFYKGEAVPSGVQKPEITEYAVMMSIVYSMVKQDCIMQERIISSLGFKPSSGELETYSLMWSLRPYINDEIMHQAWKLIP
ncbi:hypothetical protein NMG60_11024579 [Bertholletia excelsa]